MRPPMSATRRQFALGLMAAAALGPAAHAEPAPCSELAGPPLRARAAAKGLVFGTAVQQNQIAGDPAFAEAIRREAAIVTSEFELKWATVRPSPSDERFEAPDALADWCRKSGVALRGHTLVWDEA